MSEKILEKLLNCDPRIRMAIYMKDPFSEPVKVSRPGLSSVETERDKTFVHISIPSLLGTLSTFEKDFGKLEYAGANYEKLNFLFIRLEDERIYFVSYDKAPAEELVLKLNDIITKIL